LAIIFGVVPEDINEWKPENRAARDRDEDKRIKVSRELPAHTMREWGKRRHVQVGMKPE